MCNVCQLFLYAVKKVVAELLMSHFTAAVSKSDFGLVAVSDEALQTRIRRGYDVVVANIVAGVIIAIAPFAKTCCKPGAPFIVSGIIDEREDEVKHALIREGFAVEEILRSEGWVAMLLRA